jgi:hypothetical protein
VTTSWLAVLATPTPSPGVQPPDPDRVTPGTAGFLVVFLLALATVLLVRSMTGHLRKVRYSPDPAAKPTPEALTEPPTEASGQPVQDGRTGQEPATPDGAPPQRTPDESRPPGG